MAAIALGAPAGRSTGSRTWRWLRAHITQFYAALALFYLFLPVAYVLLFSFNDSASKFNERWTGFTLTYWEHPCSVPSMCGTLGLSLRLGLIATVGSTFLGTLIAFALVRHRFRGRSATNLLIFLPMATPEVVMGSSLLTLFIHFTFIPLGFWTIAIAHIMFDISFVVVTVKARLVGLDPKLEQAAMDLYATPWQTLRRVTMPLVAPGILAAALLAFALSFDDYIITNFNAGATTVTFPMFVYGAHQRGVPPQINVIGSLMFLIALALTAFGQIGRGRSARKHA
jgi:spermidine/putrescine transport system permease protein